MTAKYDILKKSILELKATILSERENERKIILDSSKSIYEELINHLSVNNMLFKSSDSKVSNLFVKDTIIDDLSKIYKLNMYESASTTNFSNFLRKYNFNILHNLNEKYLLVENSDFYFLTHILFNQLINFMKELKLFINRILSDLKFEMSLHYKHNKPLNVEDLQYSKEELIEKHLSKFSKLFYSTRHANSYLILLLKLKLNDEKRIVNRFDSKFRVLRRGFKYKMHCVDTKLKAVTFAKTVGTKLASSLLKVPEKSLKRWLKVGPERKKGGGRKPIDPILERKLVEWYYKQISEGTRVTSKTFRAEALKLSVIGTFKASKGWYEKMKVKYNLDIDK